jgi:hypothetical protein
MPVGENHGELYGASGCESWCIFLCKWLLILLCIAEQVIVNHGEFHCASGCEWWYAMLSQSLW